MHFINGLIGVVIGILLIRYSGWLTENFGRVAWAEQHMHSGMAGTYTLYKLIGLVVIILSLLYMFNAMGFILAPLGSVFGGAKPQPQ